MITVSRFNSNLKDEWNRFVRDAKNGLFFFEYEFMSYHADRFEDHSLIVRAGEKWIAVMPMSEHGFDLISHGGLTFGGLIQAPNLGYRQVKEALDAVSAYACDAGFKTITYKAIPDFLKKKASQEDLYWLFAVGAPVIRRDLSCIIELSNFKYSSTRSQIIRKAQRSPLVVTTSENFNAFHELLTEVLERHHVKPVHSERELSLLQCRFPNSIELFETRMDQKLLAGVLTFKFSDVVHTQYMAVSEAGRTLGALDLAVDFVIAKARDEGMKLLSFGISTEAGGTRLNEGLNQFKETFGGTATTLDHYRIDLETWKSKHDSA